MRRKSKNVEVQRSFPELLWGLAQTLRTLEKKRVRAPIRGGDLQQRCSHALLKFERRHLRCAVDQFHLEQTIELTETRLFNFSVSAQAPMHLPQRRPSSNERRFQSSPFWFWHPFSSHHITLHRITWRFDRLGACSSPAPFPRCPVPSREDNVDFIPQTRSRPRLETRCVRNLAGLRVAAATARSPSRWPCPSLVMIAAAVTQTPQNRNGKRKRKARRNLD